MWKVFCIAAALQCLSDGISAETMAAATTYHEGLSSMLRLRGGSGRRLAAVASAKEVPKTLHFADKLTGGSATMPTNRTWKIVNATDAVLPEKAVGSSVGGPLITTEPEMGKKTADFLLQSPKITFVEPWKRALVNIDYFDINTKGKNMAVGSTFVIPLLSICIPFALPFVPFHSPMFLPPFGKSFTRVRLLPDSGSWLNRLMRSPIAPMPGMFSTRRTDPLDAMQKRPWLAIPLKPSGPLSHPHPASRKVSPSPPKRQEVMVILLD
mmetsp:Transcript_14361/g.49065  ORF Transcript_14361/g.49065 Transcript_14361/m.49065 type:complete len:267 (-) Transcript_14361:8-808(-)